MLAALSSLALAAFAPALPHSQRAIGQSRSTRLVSEAWGGDLADEATAAVKAVQQVHMLLLLPIQHHFRCSCLFSTTSATPAHSAPLSLLVTTYTQAMQLCQALACEMAVVDSSSVDSSKTMDACDTTAGVSFIKPGDSTPVTAADFAIQGLVSSTLRKQFPNDRFMGEEDAADLRADGALRSLALRLCSEFGGESDEDGFLSAVDRGLEPNRGEGERVWVLDPIDGTKGFMTGQGYVIGLALLDARGDALIGVMGVPSEESVPPIVSAVKGHGTRWWSAVGDEPAKDPLESAPTPSWASEPDATPPWLLSPQSARDDCVPFGTTGAGLQTVCCGALIRRIWRSSLPPLLSLPFTICTKHACYYRHYRHHPYCYHQER